MFCGINLMFIYFSVIKVTFVNLIRYLFILSFLYSCTQNVSNYSNVIGVWDVQEGQQQGLDILSSSKKSSLQIKNNKDVLLKIQGLNKIEKVYGVWKIVEKNKIKINFHTYEAFRVLQDLQTKKKKIGNLLNSKEIHLFSEFLITEPMKGVIELNNDSLNYKLISNN